MAGYTKTNLVTFQNEMFSRVYRDEEGKLLYKYNGVWLGIFPEYCIERKEFYGI